MFSYPPFRVLTLGFIVAAVVVVLLARVCREWVSDEQAAAEGRPEAAGERRLYLPTPRWERALLLAIPAIACVYMLRLVASESRAVARGDGAFPSAYGGVAIAVLASAGMAHALWRMAGAHLPHILGKGSPSSRDEAT